MRSAQALMRREMYCPPTAARATALACSRQLALRRGCHSSLPDVHDDRLLPACDHAPVCQVARFYARVFVDCCNYGGPASAAVLRQRAPRGARQPRRGLGCGRRRRWCQCPQQAVRSVGRVRCRTLATFRGRVHDAVAVRWTHPAHRKESTSGRIPAPIGTRVEGDTRGISWIPGHR